MSTMVRNRTTTEDDITAEVVRRIEKTEDPRLREIMLSLVRHLHAFVKDVQLNEKEWWQGIQFLTREIGRASCREECLSVCRSRWSPYH